MTTTTQTWSTRWTASRATRPLRIYRGPCSRGIADAAGASVILTCRSSPDAITCHAGRRRLIHAADLRYWPNHPRARPDLCAAVPGRRLMLHLYILVASIVSGSGAFVMADAPVGPLEEPHTCFWFQQDGVGKEMADRIDGDAELGRAVQKASAGWPGFVSFALAGDVSRIDARNRSARSSARQANASMTRLM